MNDLISRQAAIDALNDEYHGMISDESMKIYQIINWLSELPSAQPEQRWIPVKTRPMTEEERQEAPTADVVEVVRCKDCAYKQYYFTNDMVKCGCGNGSHHEDFFCADGERRDDG